MALPCCKNHPDNLVALSEPKLPLTSLSKAGLIDSLLSDLLIIVNNLKPRFKHLSTPILLPFTKKLFKFFMQTYIDMVKNQAQIQAEI